jgi:hypothetical protein
MAEASALRHGQHADTDPSTPVTPIGTEPCDQCAARAHVRVVLPSGRDLVLCGHHGHRHGAALLSMGATIHDDEHPVGRR